MTTPSRDVIFVESERKRPALSYRYVPCLRPRRYIIHDDVINIAVESPLPATRCHSAQEPKHRQIGGHHVRFKNSDLFGPSQSTEKIQQKGAETATLKFVVDGRGNLSGSGPVQSDETCAADDSWPAALIHQPDDAIFPAPINRQHVPKPLW